MEKYKNLMRVGVLVSSVVFLKIDLSLQMCIRDPNLTLARSTPFFALLFRRWCFRRRSLRRSNLQTLWKMMSKGDANEGGAYLTQAASVDPHHSGLSESAIDRGIL